MITAALEARSDERKRRNSAAQNVYIYILSTIVSVVGNLFPSNAFSTVHQDATAADDDAKQRKLQHGIAMLNQLVAQQRATRDQSAGADKSAGVNRSGGVILTELADIQAFFDDPDDCHDY